MSTKPTGKHVEREARLRWVPLEQMKTNPLAQRELKNSWVDKIVAEMELEQLGNPTVSARGEWFYIIDGQHRTEAYKKWCGEGNWETQSLQCWTYEGMTEEEEAEAFLKLNNKLTVDVFQKFRVGVKAGRAEEGDIDRIVRAQGLKVTRDHIEGGIRAVATLRKVYAFGPATLARSLKIVRDAYGTAGFDGPVIEAFGLLCHRLNGDMDDATMIKRLQDTRGGLRGLLEPAEKTRLSTGEPRAHCIAASATEIYNRSRGGKKLPSWWREIESRR